MPILPEFSFAVQSSRRLMSSVRDKPQPKCRASIRQAAAALSLGLFAGVAAAQAFPAKPIRLVVPFPPGGPTDIVARPLAQMLSDSVKQPVVVDNRGGAGGTIGADNVAKSAPDGYSLLMATVGTHAINPSLYKSLPYDAVHDFTPIILAASGPVALVAQPSQSIASIPELIARAKRSPASLDYGSAGNGTPGHLTGEMFNSAAGVKLRHIPYKGSAPAVTDLLGGQIPLMFDPLQSVLAHVQSGKLKILGVSSARRASVLPDVPTFAEAGLPNFEATAWWAVFGPANLPEDVAGRLNSALDAAVRSAAFRERLAPLGVQAMGGSRAELASFQKKEIEKWSNSVRQSGATVE
jgi:tripartite-type tricarboxylate transporter receptor subunit TctC